jgi:hypothetical protein
VQGTDYVVSIERPTYQKETVRGKFIASETVQTFRGRISTRFWTMILRAYNEQVDAWILPVEQIFAFRADDQHYLPMLHMEPVATRTGELAWRVCETEVPWADVRKLAKELFAMLIRVARGEATPADHFSVHKMNPEKSQESSGSMPALGAIEAALKNPLTTQPKIELQKPEPLTPKPALLTPADIEAKPSAAQSKAPAVGRTRAETLANMVGGQPSIDTVIDLLNRVINVELEKLSAAGAEAFSKQDLASVEKSFKRSTRIKELHAQMVASMQHWKQALKDASES